MRLIDADALLDQYGLKDATKYGNHGAEQRDNSYATLMKYEIADMIHDAPTIETPVWTPCSEGLPKCPTRKEIKRDWYIVTLQTGIVSIRAFEFDEKSPFGYGFHEQNIIPVVAWQPLPAPYQGEK